MNPSKPHSPAVARLFETLRHFPWSLGAALGMLVFFLPHPEWHGDLLAFRTDVEALRHPFWARWIFAALAAPPEPVAYLLLSLVTIAILYAALRLYGGRHWVVFTSFSFAWTLFYGQIDALVIGGLALAWWAILKKRPYLVGAGLILASIKPQLSIFMGLMLWWWSPSRWKALVIPLGVAGLSFLQWGWWAPAWLANLQTTSDLTGLPRNLSFWPLTGFWIWLVWPLVFALPLPRPRKLAAIAAATAMTVPYFPLPSILLALVFPIPAAFYLALQAPVLANGLNLVFLFDWLRLVPPALLLWCAWPALLPLIQQAKTRLASLPSGPQD